jgi:hypothetical protein
LIKLVTCRFVAAARPGSPPPGPSLAAPQPWAAPDARAAAAPGRSSNAVPALLLPRPSRRQRRPGVAAGTATPGRRSGWKPPARRNAGTTSRPFKINSSSVAVGPRSRHCPGRSRSRAKPAGAQAHPQRAGSPRRPGPPDLPRGAEGHRPGPAGCLQARPAAAPPAALSPPARPGPPRHNPATRHAKN